MNTPVARPRILRGDGAVEGVRYYDIDNECYLDCVSGIFVACLVMATPCH